jgi:uncharacterized protein (TIGR00369 family)
MTLEEIRVFLAAEFPQVFAEQDLAVEAAGEGAATLRLAPDRRHLRPGAIVSGPTLMMLADAAAYAALLSLLEGAKMAVTSNLSVSFLRGAPDGGAIWQEARVIKPGRRLSVILAQAFDADRRMLAHATLTYVMPA